MKNKRLVVILCVFAFLTVLIVINSTIFTLQSISVNWLTTKYELKSVKDYTIADEIDKGQSIFLIDKEEITARLEEKYPYLRVVGLETKFPNKLVVHTAERESVYAVALSDSKYAIIDEKGKVLSDKESIESGSEADLGAKPITVNFDMPINREEFQTGQFIGSDYIKNLISSISTSLRQTGYTPTTSKGVIRTIDIKQQGTESEVAIQTRNGITILIYRFEVDTTKKFLLAFQEYNMLHSEGVKPGNIKRFIEARTLEDGRSYVRNYEK